MATPLGTFSLPMRRP